MTTNVAAKAGNTMAKEGSGIIKKVGREIGEEATR